jgi:hypothetical protein
MGAFGHVISLLSFVYALAITHLLLCIAQVIRHWQRVRFSWLHAFWMANAFVLIIANWISFWDMRTIPDWSVGSIFFTFAMSFANYLQAALVCPEVPPEGLIDLADFHARHARQYIGSALVSVVFALVANVVYGSEFNVAQWSAQNAAVVPMLIATVAAMIWRTRWADFLAVIIMSGAWIYYFVDLQSALK